MRQKAVVVPMSMLVEYVGDTCCLEKGGSGRGAVRDDDDGDNKRVKAPEEGRDSPHKRSSIIDARYPLSHGQYNDHFPLDTQKGKGGGATIDWPPHS